MSTTPSSPDPASGGPAGPWNFWPLLAIAATALVLVVYANGLRGPFILDDYANILIVPSMALRELSIQSLLDAAASTGHAYPDRTLARASLALNHYFAGEFDVLHFKLTNMAVHLITAAFIWLLALRLLARHAARAGKPGITIAGRPWWEWAAFLAALMWAVHPLHVSTVLYIVQRMTSMSAMFVLAGLLVFVIGRERIEVGRRSGWLLMWGGVTGGIGLGVLCKENAILLPFWVALVEIIFFDRERLGPSARRWLGLFYLVLVVLPAIAAFGFLIWKWDHFSGNYRFRPYDLAERVMTQTRALWFYLGLLAIPNVRKFGIYHDDFPLSHGLLDPWTTALSIAAWIVVVVLALAGLRRRSLFSFAVLWYLIGHVIESSVLSLELLFEHRNYIPSVGPFIAAAALLVGSLGHLLRRPRAVVVIAVALVATLSGATYSRANIWESKYMMAYFGVRNHPDSPRYRREWASMLSETEGVPNEEVFPHLQAAARLQPGDVAGLYDMARFVDWRLYHQRLLPVWDDGSPGAVADALNAPLTHDPDELRALARAIDREISRRAREEVLAVNAVEIGRHMERCINTPDPICARMLEPAVRWTGLVARNENLIEASRALSALARAKLLAYDGDVEGAIESLHYAETIVPDGITFRFEKAALMMELGRLDEAEAALDEVEARINWSGLGGRLLENLRQQVRDRRAAGDSAPGSPAAAPAATAGG